MSQAEIQAAFFDIDGTLVDGHVWAGVLAYPQTPRDRIQYFRATQIPRWFLFKLRLIDQARFRDGWVHGLARLVQGWFTAQLDDLCVWIAAGYLGPRYRPDVVDALKQHKAEGVPVVLISTMPRRVNARIAAHLGADAGLGTELEIQDSVCTGRVQGEACAGARKVDFIRAYMAEHAPGVDLTHTAAYADSFSDAPMLSAVGHPTATYPDDRLRAMAEAEGWAVHP